MMCLRPQGGMMVGTDDCTLLWRSPSREIFLKMGQPRPLFLFIFGLFRQTLQIFRTNICENFPSSIWCRDLNPQPLEGESSPITTRPGLPPSH